MTIKREDVPKRLMQLLRELKAYRVEWKFSFIPSDNEEYEPGIDRESSFLEGEPQANVISSELRSTWLKNRHHIAVDIDREAWLVPSSTERHSHLYVNMGAGIPWDDYVAWLEASAKIGLLEKGYVQVSVKRGHTDLRLPWVSKADQKKVTLEEEAESIAAMAKVANDPVEPF